MLRNSYRVDGRVRHDTLANLSSATNDEIQAIKLALKHKGDLFRINKLSDIDMAVLEEIVSDGLNYMRQNYETWDE